MTTHRRLFLKGAASVAALVPLGASAASTTTAQYTLPQISATDSKFKFENWNRLRDEFDFDYNWLNFAGFLLASRPRMVEAAIEHHRRELKRNPVNYLLEGYGYEDEARKWAGKYFGVAPEQVALTDSTTMGLATLYNNISIKAGQEVLSTEHEHYSSITSLKYRSEREGFSVNTIRLYDKPQEASAAEMLERLRKNINERTRLLALTWVHSGSSVKLPIAAVGKLVKEINTARSEENRILYCVDGVHGFGVENANFDEIGCDFFVAGTHKWMFGPSGTGIMVSRDSELNNLSPTIPPFNLLQTNNFGALMTPGGFHSFEHRWALPKAFEFHLLLGKDNVQQRIHFLNTYLKERLNDIKGVERVTPMSVELSAGFTFFRVASKTPEEVQKFMYDRNIIVSPANRDAGPVVRMAAGVLNSTREIDRVVEVLRKFA
ncbi:MAG: selenocysteine lyase/cysteine desulfurase [Gammaproteobacteria bacterium]|jgi:selenocysteine lyase/cysteine desulfurase